MDTDVFNQSIDDKLIKLENQLILCVIAYYVLGIKI